MEPAARCARCEGDLIRRSRPRLFTAGALLCATPLLALRFALLWIPAIVLALAGAYLLAWGTLGGGLWCRQCKTFPLLPG